jgi:uncharacterized protein DUF4214
MKTLQIMVAVAVLAGSVSLRASDKTGDDANSAAVTAPTSNDSNAAFVNQLFEDLYGRDASASEVKGYVEDLKTGDITFARVAARLFEAPEFHDNAAFLVKLYISLLNRDPEFRQWSQIFKVMHGGATQADAITAFMNSPEYAAAYPQSMGDTAMIGKLFQQMFDRTPETSELDRLVSKLTQGLTRRDVVEELLRSPEFESHVANRVNASLMYMAFLHHTPKGDDVSRMAESLAGGLSIADAINSILHSPEYATRSN